MEKITRYKKINGKVSFVCYGKMPDYMIDLDTVIVTEESLYQHGEMYSGVIVNDDTVTKLSMDILDNVVLNVEMYITHEYEEIGSYYNKNISKM